MFSVNDNYWKTDFNLVTLLQDVLSVAFSVDNRQIVSGSRDKTIKLWNTLAECKYTIQVRYYLVTNSLLNVVTFWVDDISN